MKNTFKRLFSLMLAMVLMVSVFPMTASAAGEGVTVTVKDEYSEFAGPTNVSAGLSLKGYLDWVVPGWEETYQVENYNHKHADGMQMNYGKNGSAIAEDGSIVRVRLSHKDVTIKVVVYNQSENNNSTQLSFTVPYGSTVNVNKNLLAKAGVNINDVKTFSFEGFNDGDSFTADGPKTIKAYIKTTLLTPGEGEGEGGGDKEDTTDKHYVKVGVKVDDKTVMERKSVEISGTTATVANLLKHKAEGVKGEVKTFWVKNADKHYDYEANKNMEIAENDQIIFMCYTDKTSDNTPSNPDTPSTGKHYVSVGVKVDGKFTMEEQKVEIKKSTTTAADLLNYKAYGMKGDYKKFWVEAGGAKARGNGEYFTDLKTTINEGDRVIFVYETDNEGTVTPPKPDNGNDNMFLHDVNLYIYKDWKVDRRDMRITTGDYTILDDKVQDGKINMSEVRQVVEKYYTNVNKNKAIEISEIYWVKGNVAGNFVTNRGRSFTSIDNLDELRKEGEVSICVMIDNAKAKSTSNSKPDSTNPKTGDEIFITVTVMAVSAMALAGAYVLNKKRMVK